MKKVANRRGSNIRLYKYADKSLYMHIPFARITAVEGSANRVWAQGGVADANMVGFDDPMTGTFKITTQIIPIELIALACTPGGVTEGAEMAVREELTCSEAGKLTLSGTPIAGTIYVFKKENDLDGAPAATTATGSSVTVTGATTGDKYVAYYLKQESSAKTVVFNNRKTPGNYIVYSDTEYKADDDTVVAEQIKCFKAMPQKAISISYQGSGDPCSLDITFDLTEDDDGNVISFTRL